MLKIRRLIPRSWHFPLLLLLFLLLIILSFRNRLIISIPCEILCPYSSQLTKTTLEFNSTHRIRHYPNFVCPQNFRNLADWVYKWPKQFDENIEITTDDPRHIAPCLLPGSIIYVRIWAIDEFFQNVYPYLIHKFVLITGEGDLSSPTHLNYLEGSNSKIIHWFGQNGQYDALKYPKFTHIPIGINCYEMADAIEKIHLQQSNYTLPSVFNDIDEPEHYIQPLDVSQRKINQSLLLINFDKGTDKTGLRSIIWNDMCSPENHQNYPFVTCMGKPQGVQISTISRIYERNRQYPFWLSPRGNGLDCHRTWEALYLDIIPIVWNTSLNILYEHLPIVIINDHQELTESFLINQFKEITRKKFLLTNPIYHYEKLRHAYWRDLILKQSRHRDISKHHRRCWRANHVVKIR